jgi:hypothetical protein
MANREYVQVVLNIPKEWADDLQTNGATTGLGKLVLKALNTGEGVLPKGHGRIADVTEIDAWFKSGCATPFMGKVPTIIEADAK